LIGAAFLLLEICRADERAGHRGGSPRDYTRFC
jgi:hypothetical protein